MKIHTMKIHTTKIHTMKYELNRKFRYYYNLNKVREWREAGRQESVTCSTERLLVRGLQEKAGRQGEGAKDTMILVYIYFVIISTKQGSGLTVEYCLNTYIIIYSSSLLYRNDGATI